MNLLILLVTAYLCHVANAEEATEFDLSTDPPTVDTRPEVSISNEPAEISTTPGIALTLVTEAPEPASIKRRRHEYAHKGTPAGIYFRISQKVI